MAHITFFVVQGHLVFQDQLELFGINATSGRGNCQNELKCAHLPNQGPIPSGRYFLKSKEMDDPNLIYDLARRTQGDWGDWRIRIHAHPEVDTFGRGNFFIHGGGLPGSKGCIDIGGGTLGNAATSRLKAAILRHETVQLQVV